MKKFIIFTILTMVFALASAQEIVNSQRQLDDSLCHANTTEQIEYLLYAGANPNAYSATWGSPLCNAVEKEIQRGTQLLIDFGAQNLSEALRYAPDGTFVDLLIKNGADVNWANKYGTALNAQAMANYGTCKVLLENGADPNSIDSINGTTPLFDTEDPEITMLLIKNGADVNFQAQAGNCIGATPLLIAIEFHRYEVAEVLLKNGANPFIRDNNGLMAIDYVPKGDRPSRRTLKRYMRH